jgi:hypothetical protein
MKSAKEGDNTTGFVSPLARFFLRGFSSPSPSSPSFFSSPDSFLS